MPRSRFKLAIPFMGKDVPSRASEFAHPDIIIGLTVLAYRYEGLRKVDDWTSRYAQVRVEFSAVPNDPFFNINRPEDLAKAEMLLTRRSGGAVSG